LSRAGFRTRILRAFSNPDFPDGRTAPGSTGSPRVESPITRLIVLLSKIPAFDERGNRNVLLSGLPPGPVGGIVRYDSRIADLDSIVYATIRWGKLASGGLAIEHVIQNARVFVDGLPDLSSQLDEIAADIPRIAWCYELAAIGSKVLASRYFKPGLAILALALLLPTGAFVLSRPGLPLPAKFKQFYDPRGGSGYATDLQITACFEPKVDKDRVKIALKPVDGPNRGKEVASSDGPRLEEFSGGLTCLTWIFKGLEERREYETTLSGAKSESGDVPRWIFNTRWDGGASISIEKVLDAMNNDYDRREGYKEAIKEYMGCRVSWSGLVVRADSSQIHVKPKHYEKTAPLVVFDTPKGGEQPRVGDEVKIRGTIYMFNNSDSVANAVVFLNDSEIKEIIPKEKRGEPDPSPDSGTKPAV